MEYFLKDGSLTIKLSGELNSGNAARIESEILSITSKESFSSLILDLENLTYISSAGLRVVLKMRKTCGDFEVVNACLDVYDVFEMTGFTSMINIKKALKKIDVKDAQLIGEGYCSYVYRIDKDTIIKVFKRATDIGEVQRELDMAKQAFILGIPTAISFDIVKVQNKFGVRFEMLDCKSLRDLLRDEPEKFDDYLAKYAHLLETIGETESNSTALPDVKESFFDRLLFLKERFEPSAYEKLYGFLSSIPESGTFVHGDCHIKNIMVRDEEFFLIDMDTLSRGHRIFEYALLYCPYVAFEEDQPGNSMDFFGLPAETLQRVFYGLVDAYLGPSHPEKSLDYIKILGYLHMLWWNRKNEPQNNKRFDGCYHRLLALMEKCPDLRY